MCCSNLLFCGPETNITCDCVDDLIELGTGYAEGISGNHPFFDGNKRTAFFAMAVFLELNGLPLKAPEPEATNALPRLAADTALASQFREWVRRWVL